MPGPKISIPIGPQGVQTEFDYKAPGTAHHAFTKKGRIIVVWVPAKENRPHHKYFCHGLTLDTYRRHGYSVFASGVSTVLMDEHTLIGDDLGKAQQGDIVVFENSKEVSHTVLIVNCQRNPKTPTTVMVWTKNGMWPEATQPLAAVMQVYGNKYRIWR